jgi:alginate O-acetyltransferase complex protein AlgI
LHGFYLIGHRYFRDFANTRPRLDKLLQTPPGTALRVAATLFCVCLGWIFFRAATFTTAGTMIFRLFVPHSGWGLTLPAVGFWYTVGCVALCHYLGQSGLWRKWSPRLPAPVLGFGYATALTLALVLAPDSGKAFIYFSSELASVWRHGEPGCVSARRQPRITPIKYQWSLCHPWLILQSETGLAHVA